MGDWAKVTIQDMDFRRFLAIYLAMSLLASAAVFLWFVFWTWLHGSREDERDVSSPVA